MVDQLELAKAIWNIDPRMGCLAAFAEEEPCHKHQGIYLWLAQELLEHYELTRKP